MNNRIDTTTSWQRNALSQQMETADISWPERLDDSYWSINPELISVYNTDYYSALSEDMRHQLGFLETVNFFSLNLFYTRSFHLRIMQRLGHQRDPSVDEFMHQYIESKNSELADYSEFCQRYAGYVYSEYPEKQNRSLNSIENDLLFYLKLLIFDEVVTAYGQRYLEFDDLNPVVGQIIKNHHETTQYLPFARHLLIRLLREWRPVWGDKTKQTIRQGVERFLNELWMCFYNPDVYHDMGFKDPSIIAKTAFNSTHAKSMRNNLRADCVKFLVEHDVLAEG